MQSCRQTSEADPFLTEIIRNGLIAATEEMKTNLMRTAYSMIIYEALDFTVGIFDAEGEILSIGLGLPMFIRGISDTIKGKIKHFGLENLHEGDVLLTNDAYVTGSHLNHLTFSVPIFHRGKIVGFSGCMAHWADIGGTLDGITTDIYSEGLQIPYLKIWRAGVPNDDILALIRMNVRLPDHAMGDLKAQIAAIQTGEKRFLELIEKYGYEVVQSAIFDMFRQSEIAARESVKQIPNGIYEAESYMDDDGVELGKTISLKVRVIVHDEEMTIDLSGLSEQVRGFYNSGETAGLSCAGVAFKCLTSPTVYPINSGSFRPLKVILPPGKVVSALRPAAMRWWMTYPMTIVDTIFKALAPAIPEKVIAGHHADLVCALIHGRKSSDNRMFLYLGGLIGGGWGAKHNADGMSATICINDGDTHNGPTEQVEAKYPLLVERYSLREDSGGAGRYRGGLGTEQVVCALSDIMFNAQVERVKCRPWGLFGGLSGLGNEVVIQRANGDFEKHPSGKVLSRLIRKGDRYILRSGGGGGFGAPIERPAVDVQQDARQGYVSRRAAHAFYGVLFDASGQNVDEKSTKELRVILGELGLPRDESEPVFASLTKDETVARDNEIVVEMDRGPATNQEIDQWRNEIRWAGLLSLRCGCCGI